MTDNMFIPEEYEKLQNTTELLTTVFLLDSKNPSSVLLLKRAATKKFAPNLYTGLGGKFDTGETALQCAERELFEESGIRVPLTQFCSLVVFAEDGAKVLFQFYGFYDGSIPPCTEGVIERVPLTEVLQKDLIPTARMYLEYWAEQKWSLEDPFTMVIYRNKVGDYNDPVLKKIVYPSLYIT